VAGKFLGRLEERGFGESKKRQRRGVYLILGVFDLGFVGWGIGW